MKKAQIAMFGFLFIFVFVMPADALLNPAAVYCEALGTTIQFSQRSMAKEGCVSSQTVMLWMHGNFCREKSLRITATAAKRL